MVSSISEHVRSFSVMFEHFRALSGIFDHFRTCSNMFEHFLTISNIVEQFRILRFLPFGVGHVFPSLDGVRTTHPTHIIYMVVHHPCQHAYECVWVRGQQPQSI